MSLLLSLLSSFFANTADMQVRSMENLNLFDSCVKQLKFFQDMQTKRTSINDYTASLRTGTSIIKEAIKEFQSRHENESLKAAHFRKIKHFCGYWSKHSAPKNYLDFVENNQDFILVLERELRNEKKLMVFKPEMFSETLGTLMQNQIEDMKDYYDKKDNKARVTVDKNLIRALKKFNQYSMLVSMYFGLSNDQSVVGEVNRLIGGLNTLEFVASNPNMNCIIQ